ncbi:hypothetical protein GCM10025734_15720 [Kitasatospora paranensis]|uniref:hypothetical protein n=1 Tax=Kitasatospora paranensis TaxID=258053 RepID=UPI0031E55765
MDTGLPDGWTIERVRSASGDSEAALLSLERLVVVEESGLADYTPSGLTSSSPSTASAS